MDRSSFVRWTVIALAIFVVWKWVVPPLTGRSEGDTQVAHLPRESYTAPPGYEGDVVDPLPTDRTQPWAPKEGELCTVKGDRFEAVLSSRGAALRHFFLKDPKY